MEDNTIGTISVSLPTDGTTADVADVNTPINTIVNEFNGNIDNANIKTAAAIAGSKLADASIDIGTKASAWDGWVPVSDSWAYASATTITVPSDATTKYSVGDKIRFTQSTVKYFYITAVTSTVLTVSGGSDYTVANSAISGIYYSKAATPQDFPAEFNWTPTFTNLSGGTLNYSKFTQIGKTVFCEFMYTLAGAGVAGEIDLTLPVTTSANYSLANIHPFNNSTILRDVGSSASYVGTVLWSTTTKARLRSVNTSQNIVAISSTVPFTWANTDVIIASFVYEAA